MYLLCAPDTVASNAKHYARKQPTWLAPASPPGFAARQAVAGRDAGAAQVPRRRRRPRRAAQTGLQPQAARSLHAACAANIKR